MPVATIVTATGTLSDGVGAVLAIGITAWIGFSVRQVHAFPEAARKWASDRDDALRSNQAGVLRQVLAAALPGLLGAYFKLPPETGLLDVTKLTAAATRLKREPADADFHVQNMVTRPVVMATVKRLFEVFPELVQQGVLLERDVLLGLLELPRYTEDHEANLDQIDRIANRYIVAAVSAVALLGLVVWSVATTDVDIRIILALGGLALAHAGQLELVRYRLEGRLRARATAGGPSL